MYRNPLDVYSNSSALYRNSSDVYQNSSRACVLVLCTWANPLKSDLLTALFAGHGQVGDVDRGDQGRAADPQGNCSAANTSDQPSQLLLTEAAVSLSCLSRLQSMF